MIGFIIRTIFVAGVGGAIGWFLADIISADNFRLAVVLCGVITAIVGSWVGGIWRKR